MVLLRQKLVFHRALESLVSLQASSRQRVDIDRREKWCLSRHLPGRLGGCGTCGHRLPWEEVSSTPTEQCHCPLESNHHICPQSMPQVSISLSFFTSSTSLSLSLSLSLSSSLYISAIAITAFPFFRQFQTLAMVAVSPHLSHIYPLSTSMANITHLRPNFLYPAALQYQLAIGVIALVTQGFSKTRVIIDVKAIAPVRIRIISSAP